jgi:hypothetical protein
MRRKGMVALGRLVLAMREPVIALEAYEQGLHGRHRYAESRSAFRTGSCIAANSLLRR